MTPEGCDEAAAAGRRRAGRSGKGRVVYLAAGSTRRCGATPTRTSAGCWRGRIEWAAGGPPPIARGRADVRAGDVLHAGERRGPPADRAPVQRRRHDRPTTACRRRTCRCARRRSRSTASASVSRRRAEAVSRRAGWRGAPRAEGGRRHRRRTAATGAARHAHRGVVATPSLEPRGDGGAFLRRLRCGKKQCPDPHRLPPARTASWGFTTANTTAGTAPASWGRSPNRARRASG